MTSVLVVNLFISNKAVKQLQWDTYGTEDVDYFNFKIEETFKRSSYSDWFKPCPNILWILNQ
jgi:hypothetical protein